MSKSRPTPEKNGVPTAKVYVFKDPTLGDPEYDWKICLEGWGEVMVVVYDAKTFEEAWQYLYENYQRETP